MSKYWKIVCLILFAEILLLLTANGVLTGRSRSAERDRLYRVEVKRAAQELAAKTPEEIDLSRYQTIVSIRPFDPKENGTGDYAVEEAGGVLYRIEYRIPEAPSVRGVVNLALGLMILLTAAVLGYVGVKILQPFDRMNRLSAELAKGNLSLPVTEQKNKFFGGFLWGIDMLREHLETEKQKELELQKEKKTLILSLSHDIKTPLSAIELYAKALSGHLYETEEKRQEALFGITKNADEIRRYVDEITQASRDDFLELEVDDGEFYLSEIMARIKEYYSEKLSVIHTEFFLEEPEDALLKGDVERVIEVLQNVMENAIKYGDGKTIRITFEEEEDCKLIRVENSGSGVKPEELPYLFDSFYRGSNSQNKKGSGLGLYISRNLMKKMNGDIFAGNGTDCFWIVVVVPKVL